MLFLEHQILYDPRMACCVVSHSSLQNSGRRISLSLSLSFSLSLSRPLLFLSLSHDHLALTQVDHFLPYACFPFTLFSQQFLYVELTAMESELKKIGSEHPARSCKDIKLEQPKASSGTFTIDPNLGSSLDSVKTYCDFDNGAPRWGG